MQLTINGQPRQLAPANLAELWIAESPNPSATRGCAIALNGRVIRKENWAGTPVSDGDRIEIVRAFAGG